MVVIFLNGFGNIGIGTVLGAVLVGNDIKIPVKYFKAPFDKVTGMN